MFPFLDINYSKTALTKVFTYLCNTVHHFCNEGNTLTMTVHIHLGGGDMCVIIRSEHILDGTSGVNLSILGSTPINPTTTQQNPLVGPVPQFPTPTKPIPNTPMVTWVNQLLFLLLLAPCGPIL